MRFVWTIAALILAAAVAAAFWPSARDGARPSDAPTAERTASPAPAGSSAPAEPALACPLPPPETEPVPASTALKELLGGDLVPSFASPTTASPEVTVGARATVERIDERTVRLDGQYTIRGSGTEADPYQITWELLGSAATSVDAAAGKFVVPGRIADLRGAWIRISGYWAPPLLVFEAKEAMVMLNKWDGCCVGLPPTPFDSIEATFARPMQVQGQHLFRFGTIRGRLSIEPFVAGTFLLGLYRLEDAVMESSS